MATHQTEGKADELKIYGYLRDVLNRETNYADIISIIIEYFKQGFAKFFDESIDANYKQKMKFGDIVKKVHVKGEEMDSIMVMDMDNELKEAGEHCSDDEDTELYLTIPFSICKHLSDANAFYSKLNQIDYIRNVLWYELELEVKYDDEWIIKNLGGALKQQYPSIQMEYENGKEKSIYIRFNDTVAHRFDIDTDMRYEDIDRFYEIRTDKNNLQKIRVKYAENHFLDWYKPLPFLWSTRFILGVETGYDCCDYVGPKTDSDMLSKMENFYKEYENEYEITISSVDVADRDVVKV